MQNDTVAPVTSFEPKQAKLLIDMGNRIRALRRARELSQEQLADLAGLHRTYIGSVERGERNISVLNAYRLADVLGVQIGRLLETE